MRYRVLLVVCVLLSIVLPNRVDAQSAARWWNDVKVLADDSMKGRQTGSPELRKTADYVAAAFEQAGLQPAGTKGYFQPVQFSTRTIDESRSSLALVVNGKAESLVLGEDASFVARAPLAATADAPLVFGGYGLQLPEYGHDDLTGLDVRGKVVVYMTQLPKGIPGPVISHSRAQAWETFRRLGAVGMIAIGARTSDSAFIRTQRNRLSVQMTLADPALDSQRGNDVSLTWNPARAQKLFSQTQHSFAALAAQADSGAPLPHFQLGLSIRSAVQLKTGTVVSDNVVGLLRGTDPVLRNEYVVLTAHMDHVGIGRPVNGDSIYNGAMDNAAGTALLMETARRFREMNVSMRRSVLFVAVTAEEKGLLGSRYFANHPTVPARSIVADLNTDMFMPIVPFKMVMINGLEESDLADDARRAGERAGVLVITDPEPEENRFIRSDQYSFILSGVPSLSFKMGFALNTPEYATVLEFRTKRYHQPQDDTAQHVDLDTAEGFTRFYMAVVQEVANRATRPEWNSNSFFRRLAPKATSSND
jgi:Zn-dependent M28 family amino/carboxypeptidase